MTNIFDLKEAIELLEGIATVRHRVSDRVAVVDKEYIKLSADNKKAMLHLRTVDKHLRQALHNMAIVVTEVVSLQ